MGAGGGLGLTRLPALLQHNNGFYGHYRGQFKNESALQYRLAAKPQPPTVFLQRCKVPSAPTRRRRGAWG